MNEEEKERNRIGKRKIDIKKEEEEEIQENDHTCFIGMN